MLKITFTIIALFIFSLPTFSQTAKYSIPTVWENYSVKDKDVSVLMPKLPVYLNNSNVCRGEDSSMFSAYSDGVVYILIVTSKGKVSEFCRERKKFDENSFSERVENLKNQIKTAKATVNKNEVKLTDEDKTYKLLNDYENKRWFELQVFGANESKAEVKNFLDSLKVENQPNGKEIGKGALRNYGDEENVSDSEIGKSEEATSKNKSFEVQDTKSNLKVILKPKPIYTDAARQANIQGTVRLRVVFLANGGIGSITPVSALPYGLTEQAIAAASKIFFIPTKRNENPINTVSIVEYSFAIY